MGYKVDNAVIMAAGTSSRFAPLSYELPKGLITVRGEILIERQIRQLRDAGISDIIVVTGYMRERFAYLADKYGVRLVHNPEYNVRNNSSASMPSENIFETPTSAPQTIILRRTRSSRRRRMHITQPSMPTVRPPNGAWRPGTTAI